MQAKLKKKSQDVTVVNLSGRIDVEYAEPFREACLKHIATKSDKLVFNMSELNFVGSNGIMTFVNTMVELSANKKTKLKFCKVGSEFKKIFAASPLAEVEIFDSEESALNALEKPTDQAQEA